MKKLLTGCYAVLLVLMAAWPAAASQAAPQYVSSEPSDGDKLHQAPERVEVTFDQPLDESSTLKILDECERTIDGGQTEVDGNTMSIEVAETPSGMYHVEYLARGLGGVTGEQDGMFMFTVHAGDACGKGGGTSTEHNGHGGNGGNGGNGKGNEHEGRHEGGGGNHGSGTHMNDDNSSGSEHSGTHAGGAETHAQSGDHSNKNHGEGTHDPNSTDKDVADQASGGEVPGITSSDTARRLLSRADSGTLLLSLALCLVLGVAGGAILRASGAK